MAAANAAPEHLPAPPGAAATEATFTLVLQPLAHPEMEDIRIEDNLFAIGRGEPPFAHYESRLVAELSRRHARIFSEFGAVYIADLGSKNGTTVNGMPVRQKPSPLKDGDEICFGRELAYRLHLGRRATAPQAALRLRSLTLTPLNGELGMTALAISRFPFLVSKKDAIFSSYRERFPHPASYLSRRHAHIFLKHGAPFIEDLGSTNGTFVAGKRLDEHAVPLQDGDTVSFGGQHLVFRVSLQREQVKEPTVTRLGMPPAGTPPPSADAERTTFVATADSFLDIFCADTVTAPEDPAAPEAAADAAPAPATAAEPAGKAPRLGHWRDELKAALRAGAADRRRRLLLWGAGLTAAAVVLAIGLTLSGAPERELKNLLARGDYAQAAVAAKAHLARHRDDAKLRALGTEALLKASVPPWLDLIKRRDFAAAAAAVATMSALGEGNDDVAPLARELAWIGSLEAFVAGEGGQGGDGPAIAIYADQNPIAALLKQWDDDVPGHQRAFTAIAAQVPPFKERYAEALSHLRKLQSDNSVYLAAIERLKATIARELARDQAEALEAVFKDYADKYPRLVGLEPLRQDLRAYLAIAEAARAGDRDALAGLLGQVQLVTPPFRERLRTLAAQGPQGQVPPAVPVEPPRALSGGGGDGRRQAPE